jgi:uncharacterized protein (DUF4213/DUF364 family)
MIVEQILGTLEEASLEHVRIGAFWTAVVVSRRGQQRCGLASTTLGVDHHHAHPPVGQAGHLLEGSAVELARLALSEQPLEASIGLAAINALLPVDETRCHDENALLTLQRKGAGRRVALVGHFPFVPRLRPAVGELAVLELNPQPGDLPAKEAAEVIPQADVVAITGTALINHTLEGLLSLCRPEAYVMVLGPSSPFSPILFQHGVTTIAGTLITEIAVALRCLSQGATFQQMEGVRTVVMTNKVPA